MIQLNPHQLKMLLQSAAEVAVASYRAQLDPKGDMLSQREAYARFGEGRVKRWKAEGKATPRRMGAHQNSAVRYSHAELLTVERAERGAGYLNS